MMVVGFDEDALKEVLKRVSPEFRTAFAAACAERLLPAHVAFCKRTREGDSDILENILSRLWEDLLGDSMTDVELGQRIDACMGLVRQANSGPWVAERGAAEDAAVAVAYALRCRQNGLVEEAAWSARHAYEAIDEYVINREDLDMNEPGAETQVLSHPLVQAELSRQRRDLDYLIGVEPGETRKAAAGLRDRARIEGRIFFGPPSNGSPSLSDP